MFRIFRLYLWRKEEVMKTLNKINKPSRSEQEIALESYGLLAYAIEQLQEEKATIEIKGSKGKIVVPIRALKLFGGILKSMAAGKPISIVSVAAEVTTQKAAEILGCSRPHLIKLLKEGEIEYTTIGKHRRILSEDVIEYKRSKKEEQKKHLRAMVHYDEDLGLYD